MFTIRAGFTDKIEIKTNIDKVRDFFSDIRNFVDLMPGVASIHTDSKGVAHWKIQADIPHIGQIMQRFELFLAENSEERLEWFPLKEETHNFMRYSADFLSKARDVTVIQFSQMVELRRKSGRELHMLAGLAGESLISSELSKKVQEMIKVFIQRAKERLES